MFNESVLKIRYGHKYEKQFAKVDKVKEWGFNVHYDVTFEGFIFQPEKIAERLRIIAKNRLEVIMTQELERMDGIDFEHILRRHDYKKRAINENSKSLIIFLVVFGNAAFMMDSYNKIFKDEIANGLIKFTEHECSFGSMVNYSNEMIKLNLSNEFAETCMDYIVTMLLKFNM